MLLLQAAPAVPSHPSTPWWAGLAVTIVLALVNTVGLVLVARAQRAAASPEADPLKPLNKSLVEHGATLADHGKRLGDCEAAIAEGTDPDVRHRDEQRREDRVATLERRIVDMERESRERDLRRHEADARMGASLARIEGYLEGHGERR